tara:strand:- start:119 stop:643 length:525 start_codon:yes stop_codon:yes gene_type:complete
MNDKTIHLSPKVLIITGVIIVSVILTIIALNSYDNSRRFKQFSHLHDVVQNSAYPERLNKLTEGFVPSDTTKIRTIKEALGMLNRDYEEVDYSELIIKGDSLFHLISGAQNYRNSYLIDNELILSKDISSYLKYLENNEEKNMKKAFSISKDQYTNKVVIKINEKTYLYFAQYR